MKTNLDLNKSLSHENSVFNFFPRTLIAMPSLHRSLQMRFDFHISILLFRERNTRYNIDHVGKKVLTCIEYLFFRGDDYYCFSAAPRALIQKHACLFTIQNETQMDIK